MVNLRRISLLAIVAVFSITSCKKKQLGCDQSFDCVIEQGGSMPEVQAKKSVTTSQPIITTDGTGRWVCTAETYDIVEKREEFPLFDPNASVIYPGNMLQGISLGNATPNVIAVKRGPGTFSIDLVNGAYTVATSVSEVKKSLVTESMNDIIRQNSGPIPARFDFSATQVESKEELALAMGVNTDLMGFGSVSGNLDFSTDTSHNRFFVKLNQSYYTISYDLPTKYEDLFFTGVEPKELVKYVYPGNPATYISDVTYGRVFYMLIESSSKIDEIEGAIGASLQIPGIDPDGNVGMSSLSSLENLSIKVIALGGESSSGGGFFGSGGSSTFDLIGTTDLSELVDLLSESTSIEAGVPISYTVRNVYDNQIVQNRLATKYDVVDCRYDETDTTLVTPMIWLNSKSITPEYDGKYSVSGSTYENNGAGTVLSVWNDDVNPVTAFAYGDNRPNYIASAVNGYPAVEFCHFNSGGNTIIDTRLSYPSERFSNTDYTVFAVVSNKVDLTVQQSALTTFNPITKPGMFMGGDSNGENENLEVGFTNENNYQMTHGGDALNIGMSSSTSFRIYTLRFSQSEGMSVYVNDQLQGTNPDITAPLDSYSGAVLGAISGSGTSTNTSTRLQMAEFKAYGSALTTTQVKNEIEALNLKYNLY